MTPRIREIGLVLAVVEELLARDLVVLDGIDSDFFTDSALTGGFGRDILTGANWRAPGPVRRLLHPEPDVSH